MPRRARQHSESGIYHVMLRGINRDPIFLDDTDRASFLACLTAAKEASGCHVLAYCLMPNHVHLLLRAAGEPIGTVVKRLGVRYSWRFNNRHGRVGHLFQDRFKSKPVDDDAYLVTLLRYIWNNPVEAALVDRPEHFRWSSRHLLGCPSALLDERELLRLIPAESLAEIAAAPAPVQLAPAPGPGRRPRYALEEVAAQLSVASGARNPAEFAQLPRTARVAAVKHLRVAGASFRQIASVTGVSESMAIRLHLASSAASGLTASNAASPTTAAG